MSGNAQTDMETFPPSPGITSPFDWAKNRKPSIFANDRQFAPLGKTQLSRELIQTNNRHDQLEQGINHGDIGPLSKRPRKLLDQAGREQIDLAPKTSGAISLKKYNGKPGLKKASI